ncbi:UDP-2,4-diacetamido-2,4,6-trideoxy-beta-L-altropyranose hydrolase [Roseobacter litoralis]|uniref:UDP-2,4-diacetamido-2,4, 6-trideoxy-beta-L-altropyranose hydrolase n=1 Tax=Roseobacter litoralis TaxID=42443 RepID=UPI0024943A3E|nr:UDP-2,4-diacetamido-2,4,6-trideoxy-beta-L-altropyranose hydrolase [Roseobacter litoralis]
MTNLAGEQLKTDAADCSKLTIAFRVDASIVIGTGHASRCLALANILKLRGCRCSFICRDLPGNSIESIRASGFEVDVLPSPVKPPPGSGRTYDQWAEVRWQQDANETKGVLAEREPNWLVLDHYAFDKKWERAVRTGVTSLMVIDDLADREHDADILLDSNLGRQCEHYAALVPDGCQILVGPKFGLLRSQFAQLRAATIANRLNRRAQNILISMGGIDLGNATSRILRVMADFHRHGIERCIVVMGENAPALEEVRALATVMPFHCDVLVNVKDMGRLMSDADVAIGAVGITNWERCSLGLPSMLLTIADNQIPSARAMADLGAAIYLGDISCPSWMANLPGALKTLSATEVLTNLSAKSAAICDGDGAFRVANAISKADLTMRYAVRTDSRRVWEWRLAGPSAKHYTKRTQGANYWDHDVWFCSALENPETKLFIFETGTLPIGYVRLDAGGHRRATVSICVAEDQRGTGVGRKMLALAHREAMSLNTLQLIAEIHPENEASIRLFEGAGYIQSGRDGQFVNYSCDLETNI